jgi:hypothetical protein
MQGRAWIADVVAGLRRALECDDTAPGNGLLSLLVQLLNSNLAQWRLEDESRRAGATDADVGRTKRGIDALNAKRHQLVERIDAAIAGSIAQSAAAPPATESLAMAFDRLTVLMIRVHEGEKAAGSAAGPVADAALGAGLRGQLATLQEAVAVLLEEVLAGTRRFDPYRSVKLYRV